MTTANLSVIDNSLARRNASRAVPFVLAVHKPNRPLPMMSLRVPVTAANRRYLRDLRNAEMRAWQNVRTDKRVTVTGELVPNAQREQRDLYVFGLIVVLTIALAGVVLAHSPGFAQQCAHWVSVVRQALG